MPALPFLRGHLDRVARPCFNVGDEDRWSFLRSTRLRDDGPSLAAVPTEKHGGVQEDSRRAFDRPRPMSLVVSRVLPASSAFGL